MEEKFGNQLSYSLALLKVFQYKKTNVCFEKLVFKEGIAVAISFAKCKNQDIGGAFLVGFGYWRILC